MRYPVTPMKHTHLGCNHRTSPGSVPDFIQSCEFDDVQKPGTVAQLHLRGGGVEAPSKVTLGAWRLGYGQGGILVLAIEVLHARHADQAVFIVEAHEPNALRYSD